MLEGSQNDYKPYLRLYSMNEKTFESLKFELTKGRFPTNENEVIISEHIDTNGGVKYEIGDTINIDIGERVTADSDNYELEGGNLYNIGNEKIINTKNYNFKVVGIIERPNYEFEEYSEAGYTIITAGLNSKSEDAYITLKNPGNYKTSIPEILGASDYSNMMDEFEDGKLNYEKFSTNDELLRWEVFAFSDDTVAMLFIVAAIVIGIIIFTSVFCIRNSIAIATTEKMKMYGMLSSVGATKKQIKKSVIFESFILGLIGIPIGICAGIFAVIVVIQIVNGILGDYLLTHVDGIVAKISIIPILLSIVLSFVTIYLSARSSARKASKVSPIDLLRNSAEIKIKSKKLKTPKFISKVFGIGGELAHKNLKRSKKKYRTTVVSITISIAVFITMNSFIVNMFGFASNYYNDYEYNFQIYAYDEIEDEVKQLVKSEYVDEVFNIYSVKEHYALKIDDLSHVNQKIEIADEYKYDEELDEYVETGKKDLSLTIIGLDNSTFKKYAKKIGVDSNKVKSVLCDKTFHYDEESNSSKETRYYNYEVGDTIKGTLGETVKNIKIDAISFQNPYGYEYAYMDGGLLVLNIDKFTDIDFEISRVFAQTNDADKFESEVEKVLDSGYFNLENTVRREKSMVLVIKIFLYGFITVITLIGVTNIFNTITSNLELRQKEFAMLKSIGMTKKEFNRMIRLETIFYGAKALIYGIALGLLGTLAIYKAFAVKLDSGMQIPVTPIIISVVGVFVLISIIMKYSIYKINKQNTIETIRKENI